MNVDIEALAASRSFAELDPQERRAVLAEVGSEDAYEAMRAVIFGARESLASAGEEHLPHPWSRSALHGALRARVEREAARRPGIIATLLNYRLPAYQPALLAAVVALVMVWRGGNEPVPVSVPERERIVYVPVHDTVERTSDAALDEERIVQRVVDSLTRELEKRERRREAQMALRSRRGNPKEHIADPRHREEELPDMEPKTSAPNRYVGLANLPGLDVQRRGKTFAEDSNAARFTVPVSYTRN